MKKETKETVVSNNGKGKKIALIAIIAIIVIAVIATIIYFVVKNNKEEETQNAQNENSLIDMNNTENAEIIEGNKQNTSEALVQNKVYEGMTITGINLAVYDGMSSFTATVENTSDKDYEGGIVVLIFTNQDGSEYARLEASIPEVKKGESTFIDAGTTSDIANAYDFRIEKATAENTGLNADGSTAEGQENPEQETVETPAETGNEGTTPATE